MKNIKKKKVINNKTFMFLVPILRYYGDNFINYINNIDRVAFGISQKGIDYKNDRPIFILINSSFNTKFFNEFLQWIRTKSFYITDYIFGNANNSDYHMIVIKTPDVFKDAYDNFIIGKYSKMFDEKDINTYFKSNVSKKILKKSKGEYLLVKEIKDEFDVEINIKDVIENPDKYEFSLPPLKKNEEF